MRAARKIIVFSSLFLLIALGLMVSAAIFLYRHPEIMAERAGKYLSDAAGIEIQAGKLEWSIHPLRIEAQTVIISSVSDPDAFQVQIPGFASTMHLEGPFGRRVLVVDDVRLRGVSVKVRDMVFEASWRQSESGGAFRNILGQLAGFLLFKDIFIREISLTNGAVDAQFQGLDLNMSRLSAHRDPDGRVKIEGETDIHMRDIDGALSAPDIRLTLQPGISFPSIDLSAGLEIKDAELTIRKEKISAIYGRFDLDADFAEQTITALNAKITAGNFLEFDGSLEGRLEPRPTFEVEAERCVVQLSDLPPFISSLLPQIKANGSLHLSGRAGGTLVDERWNLEGDTEAMVQDAAFSWETVRGDFAGIVSVTADFSFDSSGFPTFSSAGLMLSKGTFSNGAAVVDFGDMEMRFSGRHPKYDVASFSVRIPRAVFARPGNGLHFENIHVSGSGSGVDLDSGSVDVSEISISWPPVGKLSAWGRISPAMSSISVAGEDVGLIPLAVQHGLIPVDWQVSGRNRIQIEASRNSKGAIALNSEIKLEGFSFEDPAGRFIGEELSASFAFGGSVDMDTASISGELSAHAAEGELLLDLFYLDLGRNPFGSNGAVDYRIKERRAQVSRYGMKFEKLFDIVLEGTVSVDAVFPTRLSVHFARTSLSPIYDLLVREPLGRQVPLLGELQPEGKISADMEFSCTAEKLSLKGGVELREGFFSEAEKEIYAEDVTIDLPVWIEINPKGKRADLNLDVPPGRFSAAELRIPFFPAQPLAFTIEAAPNRIRIPNPAVIRIPGGRMEFDNVVSADILREGLKAETSIKIVSEDLSSFLSAIWPREQNAKLEGLLDPVVLENNQIRTSGILKGEIFGGDVSITDLEAGRIFSSSPMLKLSLDFSGIDLGTLTGGTAFGKIDGTMKGYIRNLEMAGSQPQHFDMLLETTEQGSQRQKISIKAVENISRIGAGESPFSGFAGVLTSFFETLGYEKIGVRASLNNDYFTINGTIQEDGNEYIMKRGGISGVNIVNRNPDNRIRFRDMVNRIKRVLEDR